MVYNLLYFYSGSNLLGLFTGVIVMKEAKLTQTNWAKIASEVKKINPELHKIINDLDPGPEFRLYIGEYPFGTKILKRGKFQVPVKGKGILPIYSPEVPKKIRDDLSYNDETNPVSLMLKKSVEVSFTAHNSTIPVSPWFVSEGTLFGASRVLTPKPQQPPFIWEMTSGARTIYMLPKISQARKHKKLRSELGIQTDIPATSADHWQLFVDIANCGQFDSWDSKVLYFSKEWFEKLGDPAWVHLNCFLLESVRKSFDYLANLFLWDMLLSYILNKRKLRPDLYINNTATHLFQIGMGCTPGITPTTSNAVAPIELLQKVFLEIYDLQHQIPTILAPAYYDPYERCQPIYYSINNPSLLVTPKKRDNSSVISDLYDIFSLVEKYLWDLKEESYNIENTAFHEFISNSKVKAFHPNSEKYTPLYSVEEIISNDIRFNKCLVPTNNDKVATHSAFFKGCFQISSFQK